MNVQMPKVAGDAAAAAPPGGGSQRPVPAAAVALPGAAQTEAAASPQSREPNQEQLERALENLKRINQTAGQNLQFSVDGESGQTVIRVVDSGTKEVIRQIPSAEVLELAKELDRMQGLLFSQQA